MLPSNYTRRLAERLDALRSGAPPSETTAGFEPVTQSDTVFSLWHSFREDPEKALRAFASWTGQARKGSNIEMEAVAIGAGLEHALSSSAALRARVSPVPSALLNALVISGPAGEWREAVADRMRDMRALRFPQSMAEILTTNRTAVFVDASDSLPERMRAAQGLSDIYRVLVGPHVSSEVMMETLKKCGTLPLERRTLFVILAHLSPLTRTPPNAPSIALQVLANLNGWIQQLDQQRLTWVEERRREDNLPERDRAGVQTHSKGMYSLLLNRLLQQALDAKQDDDPVPLPDVVYFEKAFNDAAEWLSIHALTLWASVPAVAAELLLLLRGIGSLRLQHSLGPFSPAFPSMK